MSSSPEETRRLLDVVEQVSSSFGEEDQEDPPSQPQYGTAEQRHQRSRRTRRSCPTARAPRQFQAMESFFPVKSGPRAKAHSTCVDGRPPYQRIVQRGRQELYTQIPFTAVFGLQRKERIVGEVFASYAADVNVQRHPEWDEPKRRRMSSQANALILKELEKATKPDKLTLPFALAVFIAAACQFSLGYNTGVMNAPAKVVFPEHSTLEWSMAVAAFAVGGPFGAASGGSLADQRGRRGALLITMWTLFAGGLLQTVAPDMPTIILSRLIIGYASGISSVLVPIYLGELAPPNLRGAVGTITEFSTVFGIFISNLLAFPLATDSAWRMLFGITPLVALVQIVLSPFLVESPRWLLNQDRKSESARAIIKDIRGMENEQEVEIEIVNHLLKIKMK